ncbi:MAG: CCA tRNA nucleotidyltransferase [Lentisphaeraceae bacterium]|nr:CCA tRNA nucleotidyltransferase [Lentisphaeraceae bacterium]
MGIPNKDIDIASDLTPEKFKSLCKSLGFKTHDTGIEHGTITVIIDGEPYEHTTFRKDVSCDGRNATIEFSKTIEEDLSRRDFTINAIAKLGDEIVDPFNGQKDLKNKKLRTVGDAEERFSEDYLRIVRAARFISRLKLDADDSLLKAAQKLSPNIIKHVSIERITDEIFKARVHGCQFFKEAERLGFLQLLFPEMAEMNSTDKSDWLTQIKRSENTSELLYLSAILVPIYKENAESRAALMRVSKNLSKGVGILYKLRKSISADTTAAALRDVMAEAKNYYEPLKVYLSEIRRRSTENIKRIEQFEAQVKESLEQPFITGDYLLKSNLKPSPFFKDVLTQCGKLQAEGKTFEEVRKAADELIQSKS